MAEFQYEIVEKIGVLSESPKGWTKELNRISWNGGAPKDNTGNVAGMLLYARTQDQIQPNNTYRMGVNQISVQTLDLNLPFAAIADQMEKIVEDYFSSEEKRQVEVQYGY